MRNLVNKTYLKSGTSYLVALLIAMLLSASFMSAEGAYIVHNVKGAVNIVRKGVSESVKNGMRLTPGDMLDIAEGGVVEILNDVSNTVYRSTKSGKTTVSRMMLDAKSSAGDKIGSVNKQLRFGGGGRDKGARVYVETGMVKRSLAEYDPDASGMAMDSETLGKWIVNVIDGQVEGSRFMIPVSRERTGEDIKKEVKIFNSGDYPLYLNILRITGEKGLERHAEISEFGQPSGCYILLPGQGIMRQSMKELGEGFHYIVGAPCQFDIDATLDSINSMFEQRGAEDGTVLIDDIPLYIEEL